MQNSIKEVEDLLKKEVNAKERLDNHLIQLEDDLRVAHELLRRTERMIQEATALRLKRDDHIKRCKKLLYDLRMQKILSGREKK